MHWHTSCRDVAGFEFRLQNIHIALCTFKQNMAANVSLQSAEQPELSSDQGDIPTSLSTLIHTSCLNKSIYASIAKLA